MTDQQIIPTINRLTRASRRLFHSLRREPTDEELARELGLPVETVRRLLDVGRTPFPLRGAA